MTTAARQQQDALPPSSAGGQERQAFVDDALRAEQEVVRKGLVYDADEVFRYLKARVSGEVAHRPKLRTM